MGKKKNSNSGSPRDFMLPPGADQIEFYMGLIAMAGVTPLEYANFYNMLFEKGENLVDAREKKISKKHIGDKTLLLKIQMKDVTKPPMWREVKVPSGMNFLQLHYVIQETVGLEDSHLWQFNEKAYNDDLVIGCESEDYGLDYVTHEAEKVYLDEFFTKPGSKLEYVYDFGDDWTFVVTLKKIIDQPCEKPECTGYKSELNAIEDVGGIWYYMEFRSLIENWPAIPEKERKRLAVNQGFSKAEDFYDYISSHRIDIEKLNEILSSFLIE